MSITDAGYGGPFAIRWRWIAGFYTERSATMHVPYTVLFDFAALRLSTVVISLEPKCHRDIRSTICELRPPVVSRPHNDRQSAHTDTPQKAPIAELRPAPPLALYEGVSCRANVLKQLLVQPTASCAKVTSMRGTVLMGKTVSHMS